MQQIKVWDECTYNLETITKNLMQLKENNFEDIDAQKAVELCKKSLKHYLNDHHVKFLLARAYTKAKEYAKGFELTKESCVQGDIGGCTLLGGYYFNNLVSKQNHQDKATLLWLYSCAKGHSQACLNLYNMTDLKIDNQKYFFGLCMRGDSPMACHDYAKECFKSQNKSKECLIASKRSCISGDKEGCLFYEEFAKGNIDPLVYEKSCNNANSNSCLKLAHYYGAKKRTKTNNILALALYENACKNGKNSTACTYAGSYYLSSLDGITPNVPLGLSYLEFACKPREIHKETPFSSSTSIKYDLDACLHLAKYYLYTPDTKYQNSAKAKEILQRTCKMIDYHKTDKLGCHIGIKECCKKH
jgi:TPR repeat protein